MKKKYLLFMMASVLFLFTDVPKTSAANVSQGVHHKNESIKIAERNQTINQLSINLNQPFTTIDLGLSNPINKKVSVTNLSKLHTQNNHHVVGAINASFFHMNSADPRNGFPSYLLMNEGKIQHLGATSTNSNDFMYAPAAFGMTTDNTAKIGKYDLSIQIEHAGKTSQLTALNRERDPDESILFTSSWSYEHTRTHKTGLEVVVETPKSVEQNVALGEKVTGKVIGIRPYNQTTSASIPKNGRGFVISTHGSEVDKVRDMKVGDDVSVSFNVDDNWKQAEFMLATGPLLVQNGKVDMTIDPTSGKARERTARTAVATDKTGKRVFFVTVDSGLSGKSAGVTLNEFANHLVKIGAYNAINLDGGGSTTMVTRKYGDVYPTLVNRPSGGTERAVNSILEAVSTAPYSDPTDIKVIQAKPGSVPVGTSLEFKVTSVLDQYYNVLPIDQSKLILNTVSNKVGVIENNKFVGKEAGTGTVNATYYGTAITMPVTVTGTAIPDAPDTAVTIGSFESTNGLQATTARSKASLALENKIQPIDQKASVRLNYDFSANKEGVSAAYMTWTNGYKFPHQPKKLGLWVYGDGNNHWLRGSLLDSAGKEIVLNFTKEGQLNWTGWKYVEASIPATASAPLTLKHIYIAETNPTKKDKGFLLFDKLQVHYTDKAHIEQAFTPDPSAREVDTFKKFTVTFTQAMKPEFFTNKHIYVEDINGVRQTVSVTKTADPRKVDISAPTSGYATGKNYRLVVTHFAQNGKGTPMTKDNITEFKVK